jgi:GT2 family glycosyltransferase
VYLIANESNLGFAAANNQALRVASGKHILLLNSDTVVPGNALNDMVSYVEVHPEVGAVGCRLLKTDGTVQRSCWRGFPSLTFALVDALYLWKLAPRWKLVQSSEIPVEDLQEPIEVDHLLGACMMVRQEVVKQVGKLDPGYFLFLEETDWCYRIKQAGYQIHYIPTAQIIHYGEQSVRKNPERSLPELYRSYCRFCRKMHHFGWSKMQLLKAIIAVAASLRVGLWLWRLFWSDRALARRMIWGYVRVLAELPSF